MEMKIEHGASMVVYVEGRLDTVTSVEFDAQLKKEEIKEDLVVLDFSKVEYISSAGLRALLSLKRSLDAQGKKLEIHQINDVVREIFNVTGFINALTVK